jgi:glyoxylase-like metal-dependent hydrolase (beta-lactamase superfamily II)
MTNRTYTTTRSNESEVNILEDLRERHGIHLLRLPTPIPEFKVNIYFIEKPVPTLIDAPPESPSFLEELEDALSALGYSIRDVRVVIVTHPHFDHYGSAGTIVEISGAHVWATRETGEWMANFEEECFEEERFNVESLEQAAVPLELIDHSIRYFLDMKQFARGVIPSRILQEGETITLGPHQYSVHGVPGHTPWCIMLYDDEEKIAFTGDVLLQDISPNPLIQRRRKVPGEYRSLQKYVSSLERVQGMNLKLALPGHGRLIENPSQRIGRLLDFIGERRKMIVALFTGGRDRTIFDLVKDLFPGLPDEQLFLAVSEVSAHLQVLEDKGILKRANEIPYRYGLP